MSERLIKKAGYKCSKCRHKCAFVTRLTTASCGCARTISAVCSCPGCARE